MAQLLDDLWQRKWGRSRSAVQLRYVIPAIARDVGHLPVAALDYTTLQAYSDALLTSGRSPATANRRLSCLSAVLREAHRRGLIPALPAIPHHRESPGRERILTLDEERQALAYCQRMGADDCLERRSEWIRLGDLVVTLLDTGCRLSEILQATEGAVGAAGLHIPSSRSKSGRGRTVPLTPRAHAAALRFTSGPRWSVDHAGHYWSKVRRALGLQDVVLHCLRHTCATRLIEAGVDIYTVSKWLGHSSVKVTERYARHATGHLDQACVALAARTA